MQALAFRHPAPALPVDTAQLFPTKPITEHTDESYPALFGARRGYSRLTRRGTGLTIISALHGSLTAAELTAIGSYRLQQYVLAGLYDGEMIRQLGITTDPEMTRLAPQDIHVCIGDSKGTFLCYVCFESASALRQVARPLPGFVAEVYPRLADQDRLFFPSEVDFGTDLYASHPGMALLPVANVREMTRLVRNQRVRSPLGLLALAEMLVATARILADPARGIEAIIGCTSPDARKFLWSFRIPLAYLPNAQDDQAEASGFAAQGSVWTAESHAPGRFWPFALASADVRMRLDYFEDLDAKLSLPLADVMNALDSPHPQAPLLPPRYAANMDCSLEMGWIAQPFALRGDGV